MASQQAEKAAELQDPEIRVGITRAAPAGPASRPRSASPKGGRSRTAESGKERAEKEGGVLIEPDEKQLQEAMKDIGRN
ncbi:unnamed protein product [Miscanthus lutarioriparius]|uniref:Uncharacterized protein n=1 Tax=Miscanthus lutarioriparius TaxID=422564 RepID=A0A811P3U5_9POAL|nr:unnamed protein product [Miscanthus lutarioriparius]